LVCANTVLDLGSDWECEDSSFVEDVSTEALLYEQKDEQVI